MKVLVEGAGGREHALVWKLQQSPDKPEVIAAPGNAGIAQHAECFPVNMADPIELADLAEREQVDLVIIGPDEPVVLGTADELRERRILAFGPSGEAAYLEGSKKFMKRLLVAAGVPTARYGVYSSEEREEALNFMQSLEGGWVFKTDELASGKGVKVVEQWEKAILTLESYLSGEAFGDAGREPIIEEFLEGRELSYFTFCDGFDALHLGTARDYKRQRDGDEGPNTGGMGSYSPVPDVPPAMNEEIMEACVRPTLAEMADRGHRFEGMLYTGAVLTPNGPMVMEHNVRFGDPETQVLLPRMESDLLTHCRESAAGHLHSTVVMGERAATTVIMASKGYPEAPETGDVIEGLDDAAKLDNVVVFHAGTRQEGEHVVTAGGRVLNVTGLGDTVAESRKHAYEGVELISWRGEQHRTDIAEGA